MAKKNTTNQNPPKQKSSEQPLVRARIDRLVNLEDSKVKAYVSVTIGNAFAVHGLRVTDSANGLFVSMPQSSYVKDGVRRYEDIFHALSADDRKELNNTVLQAYEQRIHMEEDIAEDQANDEDEDEALDEDLDEDELPFEPRM